MNENQQQQHDINNNKTQPPICEDMMKLEETIQHIKHSISKQLETLKQMLISIKSSSQQLASPIHKLSRSSSLQSQNPFAINVQLQSQLSIQPPNNNDLPLEQSFKDKTLESLQPIDKIQTSKNHLFQLFQQLSTTITSLKQQTNRSLKHHQAEIEMRTMELDKQNKDLRQKLKNGELSQVKFKEKCQMAFNQYSKQLNKQKMQLKQQLKVLQMGMKDKDMVRLQFQGKLSKLICQTSIYKEQSMNKQIELLEKVKKLQSQLNDRKQKSQHYKIQSKTWQQQLATLDLENKNYLFLTNQLKQLNNQQQKTIKQFTIQNIKLNQQLSNFKSSLSQNSHYTQYSPQKSSLVKLQMQSHNHHSQDEIRYLKQENQYLRNQIIYFNDLKKELQDKVGQIGKKYSKAKEELKVVKQQLRVVKQQLNVGRGIREWMQLQLKRQRQVVEQMRVKFQQQKGQSEQSYIIQIEQLATQLNDLKQQLNQHLSAQQIQQHPLPLLQQQHHHLQSQLQNLTERNQNLQSQLQALKTQISTLKQEHQLQLNLLYHSKEVYELEMIKFEQSSLQDNRRFQLELQMQRQKYHNNCMKINEELLEQRYLTAQLQEKISVFEGRERERQMKEQQIELLRRELQLLSQCNDSRGSRDRGRSRGRNVGGLVLRCKDGEMKYEVVEYYLIKIKEQIMQLEQQLNIFKQHMNQCMKNLFQFMQSSILQIHSHYHENNRKTTHQHHQSSKAYHLQHGYNSHTTKNSIGNIAHNKTSISNITYNNVHPVIKIDLVDICQPLNHNNHNNNSHSAIKQNKISNKETVSRTGSNLKNIKKTLKNIQSRYSCVNQQNKFYSSHLDNFIKKL